MPRRGRKGTHITQERRERMADALRKRKQGLSYPQIATELGISTSQAERDVKQALDLITREPAEALLKLELERSEEQHLRLNAEIGRCLAKLKRDGPDVKWVDQIRKLVETQNRIAQTRHRLNGFDTSVHVDASINVEQNLQEMFATIMEADPAEFEV